VNDPRRPVIPLSVENDEKHVLLMRNGEARAAANITLHPDDVGRMRAGYVCARCYEAQDKAFPKACWVCGFPMADRQAEFIAKAYQGDKHIGPSSSIADELAAMEELEERQKRAQTVSAPQIIVPRSW
jgi:hypothetical protein